MLMDIHVLCRLLAIVQRELIRHGSNLIPLLERQDRPWDQPIFLHLSPVADSAPRQLVISIAQVRVVKTESVWQDTYLGAKTLCMWAHRCECPYLGLRRMYIG